MNSRKLCFCPHLSSVAKAVSRENAPFSYSSFVKAYAFIFVTFFSRTFLPAKVSAPKVDLLVHCMTVEQNGANAELSYIRSRKFRFILPRHFKFSSIDMILSPIVLILCF